jgi:protease PrsW
MDIAAVFSLSLAPGAFWLWFFFNGKRFDRNKKLGLQRLFILGMLCLLPAIVLEYPFRGMDLVQIVIIAPFIEETIKLLAVLYVSWSVSPVEKASDGMAYAVSAALGFATSENAVYMISSYLAPQIALGMRDPLFALDVIWKIYFIRAFLTVPGHALWSGMWGYAYGRAAAGSRRHPVPKGLGIAVTLHALFNYALITHPIGAIGMLVLIPVMWRMFYNRLEKSAAARGGAD